MHKKKTNFSLLSLSSSIKITIFLIFLIIKNTKNKKISDKNKEKDNNFLLEKFNTKHSTIPFSKIKIKNYLPAFAKSIKSAKREIEKITNNPEEPNFKNTIEAFEFSGKKLKRLKYIFFNLNSADGNSEMQKIAQNISGLLSEFYNDITFNEKLFEKIKKIFDKKNELKSKLNTEEIILLNNTYNYFINNGAVLTKQKKEKLRKIDKKLSQLKLKFSDNVQNDIKDYHLLIKFEEENRLKGLPNSSKEVAKKSAEKNKLKGFLFTLNYPSYIPFVKYVEDRELRKTITIAQGRKGFQKNENNNQKILKEIVTLRFQRAKLLNFKSHSEFILRKRMLNSTKKVYDFLNEIKKKSKFYAHKQFKELSEFARKSDGIPTLKKWDEYFYSEKLKKKKFGINDEIIKPFLELENVLKGTFLLFEKLFKIKFIEIFDIDKYHKDIRTYEVHEIIKEKDTKFLAVFYADFFPRAGKKNGAWMTKFRDQYIFNKKEIRPHVSIVMNFTPPTIKLPSLLTFNDLRILYHELGHALHGIFSQVKYPSLSGENTAYDFVELPSQFLENFCYEEKVLSLFAKNYLTGENLPKEIIHKIKESRKFLQGIDTFKNLYLSYLDMEYHSISDERKIKDLIDVKKFEWNVVKDIYLFDDIKEICISTNFTHIFFWGYSAGYYSYKWSEVLDADAFEYFKTNGIFNWNVMKKFKENILMKGGSDDPMNLYKKFRGKMPDIDSLFKRSGFVL